MVWEDISCRVVVWAKTDPHIQLKLGQCLLGLWYDKLLSDTVPENFPPPAFKYQPEPLWKLNDLIQVQTMLWVRRHEWTSPVVTAYSASHILLWFFPFSIFPHPFFHSNIFHYVPPLSVFGLFQQRRLPLQLPINLNSIPIEVHGIFFQFVKSRH